MTCDVCGLELEVGMYPFCKGVPSGHGKGYAAIVRDEIPGGVWIDNLGKDPVKVYSHSERLAIMRARGLEECIKWAGPGDQHVPRWATMDPYTLEAARVLVSRPQALQTADDGVVWEHPPQFTVTEKV